MYVISKNMIGVWYFMHLFIFSNCFILSVRWGISSLSREHWMRDGNKPWMDGSMHTYINTFIHTWHKVSAVELLACFWEVREKTEKPEETHIDMGRTCQVQDGTGAHGAVRWQHYPLWHHAVMSSIYSTALFLHWSYESFTQRFTVKICLRLHPVTK